MICARGAMGAESSFTWRQFVSAALGFAAVLGVNGAVYSARKLSPALGAVKLFDWFVRVYDPPSSTEKVWAW